MAVLFDRNKKTKFPFLSNAEQKYADALIENKQDIIRINQYKRQVFLLPVEQKESESQTLEMYRLAGARLQSYFSRKKPTMFLAGTGTTIKLNCWHLLRDLLLLPTGSLNTRANRRNSKTGLKPLP